MMSSRKHKAVLIIGVLLLCGGTAFWLYRESPDQKVPRLLREMRDVRTGKFEIFYFGRSHASIEADFDRLGPRAVPGLIDGLNDPHPKVRWHSASLLGRMRDQRAVAPLIASLEDSEVQYEAVSALGEIGDSRAVDSLIPLLKNEDAGLRFRAAQALGQIGDKRAFEPLLALREDSDLYPRAHAVEALGRLGDERAFHILLQILESKEDSWVRSMAAESLGHLADRRAIPALRKATVDEWWQVSRAAKEALGRFPVE